MIIGSNITLNVSNKTILNSINFKVKANRITFFLGKSGAGKTSLMRCIANLNNTYTGSLTFNGQEITTFTPAQRAKHIGFVAQSFNLFPHMTVLKNCSYPLQTVLGFDKQKADKCATATLNRLHIDKLSNNYPENISGGQQQRVAIARALCMKPEVLIMDEPTSALDPTSTQSLVDLIVELHELGLTLCISSHDVSFVRNLLDYAYLLEDGRVVDIYDKQTDMDVRGTKIKQFLQVT